LEIEHSYIG